jgi:hypothetical protein
MEEFLNELSAHSFFLQNFLQFKGDVMEHIFPSYI